MVAPMLSRRDSMGRPNACLHAVKVAGISMERLPKPGEVRTIAQARASAGWYTMRCNSGRSFRFWVMRNSDRNARGDLPN